MVNYSGSCSERTLRRRNLGASHAIGATLLFLVGFEKRTLLNGNVAF